MILTHRYLGVVLCAFFMMWFVSGIAMIYARGMPGFTPDMRLERLAELNMGAVKVTASEAVAKAELHRAPARAILLMIMDRPAYRFSSGGGTVTVFADTGEVLEGVGRPEAVKIASAYMELPESKLHYAGELNEPVLEDRQALGKVLLRHAAAGEHTARVEIDLPHARSAVEPVLS